MAGLKGGVSVDQEADYGALKASRQRLVYTRVFFFFFFLIDLISLILYFILFIYLLFILEPRRVNSNQL